MARGVNWSRKATRDRMRRQGVEDITGKSPIAPIAGGVTNVAPGSNPGNVTRVYYYHRYARRHARRCYRSGGACYYC
jgi:hypothetical protein